MVVILFGLHDQFVAIKTYVYGDGTYYSYPWHYARSASRRDRFRPVTSPNGTLLGAANRSQSRRVRYLRTRFSVPLASNAGLFSPKQGLALLRMLEEALDTTLEVQADFAKCNPDLVGRQIREAVSNDGSSFTCQALPLPISLSLHLSLSIYLSFYLSVNLSVCLTD